MGSGHEKFRSKTSVLILKNDPKFRQDDVKLDPANS